jgi:hypothetical protein
MSEQCIYKNNGNSCKAYAIHDSKFCFAHDPDSARKRAYARKKGGLNRRVIKRRDRPYRPIKSVEDINSILESAINEARVLEGSKSNLRTLAYLCQIAMKGQELGSLEERISAIEAQITKFEGQR